MGRLDMHTLQEFVRLARMGTGFRAIARMVRISPNTEREYRKALEAAGLLAGDPNDLPELATLQAQAESPKPKWAVIKATAGSIKAVLENAAGGVLVAQALPYLTALL